MPIAWVIRVVLRNIGVLLVYVEHLISVEYDN